MEMIDIQRCCKKTGNNSRCARIATFKSTVRNCKSTGEHTTFRCDKHKTSSTVSGRVVDVEQFEQPERIIACTNFLRSLVGKKISSRFHRVSLTVKFIKPENLTVMCQANNGRWHIVYPNQVEQA